MTIGILKPVEDAKRRTWSMEVADHPPRLGTAWEVSGIFTYGVEVGLDQKVMNLLEAERRRAAGLMSSATGASIHITCSMKVDVKRNISPDDWNIKASLHIQPRLCSVAILSTSLVP